MSMTQDEKRYAAKEGICGYPCYYGGLSATRKYSASEMGWLWHCNRKVTDGGRCWQHRDKGAAA